MANLSFRYLRAFRARRAVTTAGIVALAVGGLAACEYPPDGTPATVAFAGATVTDAFDEELVGTYMPDPDPDDLFNINGREPVPFLVPGDPHCGLVTYHTPPGVGEVAPPYGSTAGRNALRNSVLAGDGCIDIARSALPPVPTDLATFRYYAFGLDAVGWSTASPLAPLNITLAQLRGIYNCTFTNWSQVGGGNGLIERYWFPLGSGSDVRQLFIDEVLGFDPGPIACPIPMTVMGDDNSGALVAVNGDQARAIMPFSGSGWNAQANSVIADVRFGQRIGSLNSQRINVFDGTNWVPNVPTAVDPTAPMTGDNVRLVNASPAYPGVSYVWHVVDVSHVSYASAVRYVGFENIADGLTSPLCGGGRVPIVSRHGFVPLDTTLDAAHNQAGSTCREYS